MAIAEWTVEINGAKSGPYTIPQLLDFYREGRIQSHHQVTSDRLNGEWVPVQVLMEAYEESTAPRKIGIPEAEPKVGFPVSSSHRTQLPPRPEDLTGTFLRRNHLENGEPEGQENFKDPTESLFEALQIVRERQSQGSSAQRKEPSGAYDWGPPKVRVSPSVPRGALIFLSLTLILVGSVFALFKIFEGSPGKSPSQAVTAPSASPQTPRVESLESRAPKPASVVPTEPNSAAGRITSKPVVPVDPAKLLADKEKELEKERERLKEKEREIAERERERERERDLREARDTYNVEPDPYGDREGAELQRRLERMQPTGPGPEGGLDGADGGYPPTTFPQGAPLGPDGLASDPLND
jgi:hypothetical protein